MANDRGFAVRDTIANMLGSRRLQLLIWAFLFLGVGAAMIGQILIVDGGLTLGQISP